MKPLSPTISGVLFSLTFFTFDMSAAPTQQAYLKASNPGLSDQLGLRVAISGDTLVIAAEGEDSNATGVNGNQFNNLAANSGAVYVFVRNGTNWIQQAYLKASNTAADDQFGSAVAISGDTIVVGAGGEDSNATGVNGNQSNNSASFSGAAYVFVRNGTNWTQLAYLKASNTGASDFFGRAVVISDDTIVVGAANEASIATGVNGNQGDDSAFAAGAAYVFVRTGTNWTQQAYLKASNAEQEDYFGWSGLGLSGDTIVVGALYEASIATGVNGNQSDNSARFSGAAYVFVRNGTNWTQQAYLKQSNTSTNKAEFGMGATVSGDTIVIGASEEDSNGIGVNGSQNNFTGYDSGAAYVFVRNGTNWSQQAYLKASNRQPGYQFGCSADMLGDTVVIGSWGESSNATGVNGDGNNTNALASGAAYVFVREGTNWTQQAYLKASNTEASDDFGRRSQYRAIPS